MTGMWTLICEKRAEMVNNLLKQAKDLGIETTRRQARKALSNRGSLRLKIRAAEEARVVSEARQ